MSKNLIMAVNRGLHNTDADSPRTKAAICRDVGISPRTLRNLVNGRGYQIGWSNGMRLLNELGYTVTATHETLPAVRLDPDPSRSENP